MEKWNLVKVDVKRGFWSFERQENNDPRVPSEIQNGANHQNYSIKDGKMLVIDLKMEQSEKQMIRKPIKFIMKI